MISVGFRSGISILAPRWKARTLRRAASVCLLLGWASFWIVTTLQPCCRLAVTVPHLAAAETTNQSPEFDHHSDTGHHTPDSNDMCRDITIVAAAAPITLVHSFASELPAKAYPACAMQSGHALRRKIYAAAIAPPSLPPPQPIPFHLRTSRLLI